MTETPNSLTPNNAAASRQKTGRNRTVFRLVTLVSFMLALSFASVPLYDWFCRVTGFGGTPGVATANTDGVLEQINALGN